MCSGKMGKALKFSIFDRSVALPECRHRLPLPVAISLDVSCYSYNLTLFILQPIASSECQYVIKVSQTSKTKSRCSSPTQIQWSVFDISRKRMSKSLCMGGLSIHFSFKTLGMDEMRYWPHTDVISRTTGLTPCLLTLKCSCLQKAC